MKTVSLLKTALLIMLCAAPPLLAQNVTWSVNILPAGSSTINWSTTIPVQGGKLIKSGKVTFAIGSDITFHFAANAGYKLIHVYKNMEDEIGWVDSHAGNDTFGPVGKPHTIIAVCELLSPTGSFTGNYTDGKGVTAVADVTGNYSGNLTVKNTPRAYDADIAMDDSGKLSAMGTVSGLANKDGGAEISSPAGSVKTVDDKPYATLKGGFNGTVDGKPASGSCAASGDLVFETVGAKKQFGGVASGTGVVDGVKSVAKSTARSLDVPPADVAKLKKAWGLTLSLVEVPATAKVKKYVTASGVLRLTSGESSKFLPKKVTYSAKTGYIVNFVSGQKLDSLGAPVYVKNPKTGTNKLDCKGNPIPVIDKKSTVKISKMLLNKSGAVWVPASGLMEYKFLGQKGKGDIASFLD